MRIILCMSYALVMLLGTGTPSHAQFCPSCGTNPCRLVARQKGLTIKEPPSPVLLPEQNVALGGLASRLALGNRDQLERLRIKLLTSRPTSLLYALEQMTTEVEALRNPRTLEQWGRAVQVDIVRGLVVGTAGTVPNRGVKLVASAVDVADVGYPSQQRARQLLDIINESMKETLDLSRPKLCETTFDSVELYGSAPVSPLPPLFLTQTADAQAVRERVLLDVLIGFNEAGLYDQCLEFHRLALQSWGSVRNATLSAQIAVQVRRAGDAIAGAETRPLTITATTTATGSSFLVSETINRDVISEGVFNLASRLPLTINFRYQQKGSDGYDPRLQLDFGRTSDSLWPEGFRWQLLVVNANGKLTSQVNGFVIGLEVAALERDSWNALQVRGFGNQVSVYLNGELIAGGSLPTGPSRSVTPPSWPLAIRIVGSSGAQVAIRLPRAK